MNSVTIWQEIQNENRFVFKRLFNSLYQELVTYANEYLFDIDSSEDVVQEVFIYIWEKSNEINLKTNLKAYMYAMVRNKSLNILKAVKLTDMANTIEGQAVVNLDYSEDLFSQSENQIVHRQLINVIENLPSKMRTIVKLRFMHNYKYAEIADEMCISVNTVKTQLKRAKVKFGKLIISFWP